MSIAKKYPLISKMRDDRIFLIIPDEGNFEMVEGCDEYFGTIITKQELLQLAEEIKQFAEEN
jgi:hypothetical protein